MIFGRLSKKLHFRQDAISLVLADRHDTLEGVANGWAAIVEERPKDFPPAPSRSTIHDWVKNGFPSIKRESAKGKTNLRYFQALAFCGLLDVDPLAIFDLERNRFASRFAAIRRAIYFGPGALGAYSPLFELYQPNIEWPSDQLAEQFWGRHWFNFTFSNEHEFQSQDYALIKVRFAEEGTRLPRAVHMAYRRWDSRDTDPMWRFYGSVIGVEDRLELINEGGRHEISRKAKDCDIQFRTYFGGRKVEFKIASLHSFENDIEFPCNDMSIIGFNW